ncbi:MAG: hypothetical protein MR790_03935 [Clostridiales bacterium]|nr:hypothetical protein [Clostridiales bacterium]
MTIEEAIEWMQEEKASFERAPDLNGCPMTEYWQKAIDVYDMALSALRRQDHFREVTKKVEPLTLDELRKMDGEPVWCEIYIKGQPSFYGIVHGETVTGFISGDDKPANLAITNVGAYGLAWLAYRQKPEDGTV